MTKGEKVFQFLIGLSLCAVAAVTTYIDISNNWKYAIGVSEEMAIGFVMAAVCVYLLPTAASLKGWNRFYIVGTAIAAFVTIVCAYQAYTARQDAVLLNVKDKQEIHDTLKADAQQARSILASIQEVRTVQDLIRADEKAEQEVKAICANKKRKEACTRAKVAANRASEDLAQGRARDDARATLNKAEATKGKSERFASDNIENERWMAHLLTYLIIFFTPFISLGSGYGAGLMRLSLAAIPPKTQKAVIEDWRATKTPRKKKTLPANVTPIKKKSIY